jgi:N-methylhydantoinase A
VESRARDRGAGGRDDAGRWSVGVDVGGTFTDLAAVDADGVLTARKVLSTPYDQSEGVGGALAALGAPPASVGRVVHGTTVVTNLLLERSGARVVLCATAGATDLLELRRQERAALYDLAAHHPPPLVAPEDVVGVPERVTPDGVERPLSRSAAAGVARSVCARAPEIVAVALLHAYADPRHERLLAEAIGGAAPGVDVVLASDVLPEIREYERTATTVAEAYARPSVARYLRRLGERLERDGYPAPAVMTSGGGLRSAAEATRGAASLALSGPAGGVVGAAVVARAAGYDRVLTIDIGGTSADVGLVVDGEPLVESGGRVAGVPIALPRVLVETVSAGGGSLLWVDDGGALRVGPRSAGAEPGPAAFGRGGAQATVTDAHVALRNIRADRLSGGVRLDPALAERALRAVADRLGATVERVATAAIAAADAEMARALRRVSVERGIDPRGCVLAAFGGGGPLHACGLAERLAMRRVLVPPHAGVLSAVGLALGAERRESLESVMRVAGELDASAVTALAGRMRERAAGGEVRRWWARARYQGQGHELEVPFAPGDDGPAIAGRFATLHRERFGFTLERPVEVVSARHAASGAPRGVRLARAGASSWTTDALSDDGGEFEATVRGRATVALSDATLLVAEGWTARPLPVGGWLLERDA